MIGSLPHSATLHVRNHCLCLHAQCAARALTRRFDEAFRPVGITSGQFSLLMALNRPEPPRLGEAAELLAMDRTTLTANLKPLRRRGFVAIRGDGEDKRVRRLVLTAAGRSLLAKALPMWERKQAECESLLDDAERARADLRALGR
jgi:DNA-binding MarR family transcriptional regulator